MKTSSRLLMVIVCAFAYINVSQAQWTGPSGNILSTTNTVNISQVGGAATCSGCPPIPPLLDVNLTGLPTSGPGSFPSSTMHPLCVSYEGRVGIGTNTPGKTLHIANGGNFGMTRLSGSYFCNIESIGRMVLTTDGYSNNFRGFFINNGSTDIFKVTPEMILYTNGGMDLFKVDNSGFLSARKVTVTQSNPFPDYVFKKDYKLMPVYELEAYINANGHLPKIQSEAEVAQNQNQVDVGDMQTKLLEKVEELTLYIIQQQKQIDELKSHTCK